MRSAERQPAPSGQQMVQDGLDRIRRLVAATPWPLRPPLILLIAVLLVIPAAIYAPYALWTSDRSAFASASVAVWGTAIIGARTHGYLGPRIAILLLPAAVALLANLGGIGRGFAPCRTV